MKEIFHLEANGKTNTGIYVSKILSSTAQQLGEPYTCKVFTSEKSFYNPEEVIPVFRKYGTVSNSLLKLIYYIKGFLGVYIHLYKKRNENNLLHLHWLKFSLFDFLILTMIRRTNTKLVFTVHNVLPHENSFIDKLIYPLIYKKVDAFTFHSESTYHKLVDMTNIDINEYSIIPHYGNKVNITPATSKPKRNSFLFFGSIREYKGLDVLLDACIRMQNHNDWSLHIYGKPEMDITPLMQRVSAAGVSDKIEWHTRWIEEFEIDRIFNKYEIVILPYKRIDNSGLLHLAMSYGKPVIASRLGSLADLIVDGENGLLFEAGNAVELSDKMIKLILEDELKKKLGNNARQLMEKEHSLERVGQLHSEFYKKLL